MLWFVVSVSGSCGEPNTDRFVLPSQLPVSMTGWEWGPMTEVSHDHLSVTGWDSWSIRNLLLRIDGRKQD